MKLTGEQFNEFLDSKKAGTYKCPVCAHEEFSLGGGGKSNALAVAAFELTDPTLTDSAHSLYSMTCENCGHTVLFHQRVIAAWLKSKAAKDG